MAAIAIGEQNLAVELLAARNSMMTSVLRDSLGPGPIFASIFASSIGISKQEMSGAWFTEAARHQCFADPWPIHVDFHLRQARAIEELQHALHWICPVGSCYHMSLTLTAKVAIVRLLWWALQRLKTGILKSFELSIPVVLRIGRLLITNWPICHLLFLASSNHKGSRTSSKLKQLRLHQSHWSGQSWWFLEGLLFSEAVANTQIGDGPKFIPTEMALYPQNRQLHPATTYNHMPQTSAQIWGYTVSMTRLIGNQLVWQLDIVPQPYGFVHRPHCELTAIYQTPWLTYVRLSRSMSTCRFAQRVAAIKNNATVNEDAQNCCE